MGALTAIQSAVSILLVALAWWMPRAVKPTLPLGVHIPHSRGEDPVVLLETHRYQRSVLAGGGTVAVLGIALTLLLRTPLAVTVSTIAVLAVLAGRYYRSHSALSRIKEEGGWYAERTQSVVADTSLRTDPVRLRARWLAPALGILALTAVVGILRYPHLPARLTTHYGTSGADRTDPTSVGTAFQTVFVQAGVTVVVLLLTLPSVQGRPELEAARPHTTAEQHRLFLTRTLRGTTTRTRTTGPITTGITVGTA
ncbi:DUF1648 domain-containing protein [Streptomyces sp. NPDC001153]